MHLFLLDCFGQNKYDALKLAKGMGWIRAILNHMHLFKDKYVRMVLVLLGILLAIVLSLMGVRGYMRWEDRQYFGEIIRITDMGFVITDSIVKERIIDVSDQTVVKKGPHTEQDGFHVGDHVIIVGEASTDGHVQATLVRIVENNQDIILPRRKP
ncbi:MAG: hypothetical protein A3C84_00765 [Candidatus Ryanbacteria bacterium RIFCSPHIGHO2_02_FULL_48_12]|uniref:DUF5666 domain-containing protein n=1 Tax=Candidatus Ryanbacteria bacterium RIFCSPHIGHO2_01_FULL_48_27 TaxID=1802115 RepID=A0A1G2G6B4_9BACT|nr:MAG: hypothetical protein A2756_02685 [Candidatus Ryanbacteria bacterium RIFCSPHIGHO2_01_FULL_48_27]OGZ49313.1 MAG: hypothetical protein A3C84_00765 [Candidatus Ryanbacteria bacterium RIFCSPHIGHO2_02_FULL_48_12]